jgi:hypothetical protein
MNPARQVVRWSIPGWLYFLLMLVLQAETMLIEGQPFSIPFLGAVSEGVSGGMIALLVAGGVPLGFILYQVYYSWYGSVLPFHLVNRDRGADVLLALPEGTRSELSKSVRGSIDLEMMYEKVPVPILRYPLRRLKKQYRNKAGRTRYEKNLQRNWDLVRFHLHTICSRSGSWELKEEVTSLCDIYHGIGASRATVFLACISHSLYNVISRSTDLICSPRTAVAVIGAYPVAYLVFRVLERTRTHTLTSLLSLLRQMFLWYSQEEFGNLRAHRAHPRISPAE